MDVLKIKLYGIDEPIATVISNLDETFKVKAENPEDQKYFSELINNISKEHPNLPLISGSEKVVDGEITNQTIKANVANTDIKYLYALWDYLNKLKNITYKGKRIRAYVINQEEYEKQQLNK